LELVYIMVLETMSERLEGSNPSSSKVSKWEINYES
jgi:hypothetical protein